METKTSPVTHAYWSLEKEDQMLRNLIDSSASTVEFDDDIEKFDGIAFEIKDDEIRYSKGWKEFFSCELPDSD